MTVPFTTQSLQDALTAKLALNFGTEPGEATDQEMLKACALVLRDVMALRGVQTAKETKKEQKKQVHYLSLEFLMGRSLMKNAYNLGVLPELKEALGNLGFKSGDLFELEPDAGLGNGGLGRLAACYLDSMTTLDIPATGYSICYELGIFKQKIVEGQQVELPDDGRALAPLGCCPSPTRRRPSTLAVPSGNSGMTAISTSSTRTPPPCWPFPATWWWRAMIPTTSTRSGCGTPGPPALWI